MTRLHLEGKLESHFYPCDQAGAVFLTALKWKKNVSVRLVFLTVIWAQLLGCACLEDPTKPLQSLDAFSQVLLWMVQV